MGVAVSAQITADSISAVSRPQELVAQQHKPFVPEYKSSASVKTKYRHPTISCRFYGTQSQYIGCLMQCIMITSTLQQRQNNTWRPEVQQFNKKGSGVWRKFFISKDLDKLNITSRTVFPAKELIMSRNALNFMNQNAFRQKSVTWSRFLSSKPKNNMSHQSKTWFSESKGIGDLLVFRGKSAKDQSVYFIMYDPVVSRKLGQTTHYVFRIPIERLRMVFARADMFRLAVMRRLYHTQPSTKWLFPHQLEKIRDAYIASNVPKKEWPPIIRFMSTHHLYDINIWQLILAMWLGDRTANYYALVRDKFNI